MIHVHVRMYNVKSVHVLWVTLGTCIVHVHCSTSQKYVCQGSVGEVMRKSARAESGAHVAHMGHTCTSVHVLMSVCEIRN